MASAGASLNEPPQTAEIFSLQFFDDCFSQTMSPTPNLATFFGRHLQQVRLHGPLYVALSGV